MGLAAVKHDPPPNELERAALEMHQKALEQQKTAPTPSIDDYADAIYSTMKKLITVTIDKRVRELETRLQVSGGARRIAQRDSDRISARQRRRADRVEIRKKMTAEDQSFLAEIRREIDDGNGDLLLQLVEALDRDQRAYELMSAAIARAARPS